MNLNPIDQFYSAVRASTNLDQFRFPIEEEDTEVKPEDVGHLRVSDDLASSRETWWDTTMIWIGLWSEKTHHNIVAAEKKIDDILREIKAEIDDEPNWQRLVFLQSELTKFKDGLARLERKMNASKEWRKEKDKDNSYALTTSLVSSSKIRAEGYLKQIANQILAREQEQIEQFNDKTPLKVPESFNGKILGLRKALEGFENGFHKDDDLLLIKESSNIWVQTNHDHNTSVFGKCGSNEVTAMNGAEIEEMDEAFVIGSRNLQKERRIPDSVEESIRIVLSWAKCIKLLRQSLDGTANKPLKITLLAVTSPCHNKKFHTPIRINSGIIENGTNAFLTAAIAGFLYRNEAPEDIERGSLLEELKKQDTLDELIETLEKWNSSDKEIGKARLKENLNRAKRLPKDVAEVNRPDLIQLANDLLEDLDFSSEAKDEAYNHFIEKVNEGGDAQAALEVFRHTTELLAKGAENEEYKEVLAKHETLQCQWLIEKEILKFTPPSFAAVIRTHLALKGKIPEEGNLFCTYMTPQLEYPGDVEHLRQSPVIFQIGIRTDDSGHRIGYRWDTGELVYQNQKKHASEDASLLAKLYAKEEPIVPKLHGCFGEGEQKWLVTEVVMGEGLDAVMQRPRLEKPQTTFLMFKVFAILEKIHEQRQVWGSMRRRHLLFEETGKEMRLLLVNPKELRNKKYDEGMVPLLPPEIWNFGVDHPQSLEEFFGSKEPSKQIDVAAATSLAYNIALCNFGPRKVLCSTVNPKTVETFQQKLEGDAASAMDDLKSITVKGDEFDNEKLALLDLKLEDDEKTTLEELQELVRQFDSINLSQAPKNCYFPIDTGWSIRETKRYIVSCNDIFRSVINAEPENRPDAGVIRKKLEGLHLEIKKSR